jgi:hypothetical protein
MCPFHGGFSQPGSPKPGTKERGLIAQCFGQIGLRQLRMAEVGSHENGLPEVGLGQVGRGQMSLDQACALKVCASKLGCLQTNTLQIGVAERCGSEVRETQIRLLSLHVVTILEPPLM